MSNIKVFENKQIRTLWNEQEEDWYFSVVDVIAALTDSDYPQVYWRVLKKRLKDEGNETVTNCNALKMAAKDGKNRLTDVVNTKDLLRLIQSIPSPKAEPFKIDRAVATYREKGYSEEWITQRMMTIKMRKELTAEWKERGINDEKDYAILTNEMTKAWSGMSVQEYKKFKGLKKENLRDNMTNIELVLNMLAEVTTTELSQKEKPETFKENKEVARRGGKFAGDTRKRYEKELGRKVLSKANANDKKLLDDKKEN